MPESVRTPLVAVLLALAALCGAVAAWVAGPDDDGTPTTTTEQATSTTAADTTTTVPDTTTTTAPPTTTTTVPPVVPVHPGLPVDPDVLPAPAAGWSRDAISPATSEPYDAGVSGGAFRTNCSVSHYAWDDPIVAPGSPGMAHLHTFFGNTALDAYTTPANITDAGNSTCWGGTVNRSGYWVPTMIDLSSGEPVELWGENGLQVYYKTGYQGVPDEAVQTPPAGLRMIAGDAMRSTPGGRAFYDCNGATSSAIPDCPEGSLLIMHVPFPQCWDGQNLDSADHQSHMAYGSWGWVPGQDGAGCPASHPVPIINVEYLVHYVVGPGGSGDYALVSDTYLADGAAPAGYSGHGDWMNGWDQDVLDGIRQNCLNLRRDCRMNLLGDGRMLDHAG